MRVNTTMIYLVAIFIALNCQAQIIDIEDRTIDYYLYEIDELEYNKLIDQGILIDSVTISEEYKDSISGGLTHEGFMQYANNRIEIYQEYFKDLLYQQKLEYANDIYVLYFTVKGLDDLEWSIIKWKKDQWKGEERLSLNELEKNNSIEHVLSNYDEGPKNIENIRIFLIDDYLIMERGNLYHSLYDLKKEEVILNEFNPWAASGMGEEEEIDLWIKENLHDKIDKIITSK